MKREFRLRQEKDIQRLRNDGQAQSNRYLVLLYAPQPEGAASMQSAPTTGHSRIGVITGKRLGGAVIRNKVRRRLRAVMHQVSNDLPAGWDFLILARKPIVDASFQEIETAVWALFRRAGFRKGNDGYSHNV